MSLRVGDVLTLDCQQLDLSGAGVASTDDLDVFVSGALPGARLALQVDHVSPHEKGGKRRAWAHVLRTVTPSPHLQAPACPAFGACGGCVWQHLAYPQQLHWKRLLVQKEMQAVFAAADPTALVPPCVPSPLAFGYRNQAKYVVEPTAEGVRLGGYAPRSHDVVDLTECALVEAPIKRIIGCVRDSLSSEHHGLRHVVVRANHEGRGLLTLVFARSQAAHAEAPRALALRLLQERPELVGVVANINETAGDVIFGDREFTLAGEGHVGEEILGARLRLSPRAFFQVNRHVAALAYHQIIDFARTLPSVRVVWDVYAGVGTIARVLCAALGSIEHAVCVEIRAPAVEDARSAADEGVPGGAPQMRFVSGSAEHALGPDLPAPHLVVLNPPRAGCHPDVLARVAEARPSGIAYLSCNPVTLARDLGILQRMGQVVQTARPFDMLPHTPHVETLALLRSA